MRALLLALPVPVLLWAASRLVLLAGMVLLAGHIDPHGFYGSPRPLATGWDLFVGWDSGWYRSIAQAGYEYKPDGAEHNVAFFPLYPLSVRALMAVSPLDFAKAGMLVNNAAFLAAVVVFHRYVTRGHGARVAAWATATLCFYPYSLFGSVAYAEGLLLLLIVLALSAFEAGRYKSAWLFGGLATAAKIVAAPLIPAFLLVAWLERRGVGAFAAAVGSAAGLAGFAAYCAYAFGDPLAFVHVQTAWRGDGANAAKLWAAQLLFGGTGVHRAAQPALGLLAFFGGGYLLWMQRKALRRVDYYFGGGLLLLLAAAGPMSVARSMLMVAPVAIACGLTLAKQPKHGLAVLAYFALALAGLGVGWAYKVWIA